MMSTVKTEAEIAALRESGRMLATVLELMRAKAKSGVAPKICQRWLKKNCSVWRRSRPFLGFYGYPDIIVFRSMTKCSTASERPAI